MKLHEALGIDMEAINQTLRSVVESDPALPSSSLIREQTLRLIAAGGKRLRPIMVVVGSRFGDSDYTANNSPIMHVAALLEYMHTASLIHDDIIDRSELRRGEPTLHIATDVRTAVHIANYMLARVLEWATEPAWSAEREQETGLEAARDHNQASIYQSLHLASTATELCLGEYGQLNNRFNYDLTLDEYMAKTRNKTALLMALCLRAGAAAAHADEETCQLLYEFGEALGIAFQITDDVLDLTTSAEVLGKPAGADLRNGNITLPVMYALENPSLAPRIRALHEHSSEEELLAIIESINESGAAERALQFASEYAARSLHIMERLSRFPACHDLRILYEYFTR